MPEFLIASRPDAAANACVAMMQIFLLSAMAFGSHDRRIPSSTEAHPRASRRAVLLAIGYVMAVVCLFSWSLRSTAQSAAAFAITTACCWIWTVLASRWQEWAGGAVGIGIWTSVMAAAGVDRLATSMLILTSFTYLFLRLHFTSKRVSERALRSGERT